MEAYKFETTVARHGIVQIPEFYKFENKKVQIVITLKEGTNKLEEKKEILNNFFKNWGGFFSTSDNIDDDRYNYLMEKYK